MSENITVQPEDVEVFIDAFKSIGGGHLALQVAQNLQKAVKSTYLNEKKSSISINIDIHKANDEMITLTGTTKANLPANKITGAFFVNQQTFLPSRNRPDQLVMTFDKK